MKVAPTAGRSPDRRLGCCQLRALFEGVRVQPTLSFQFGYGLEPVGVSLRVSLNPKVRDRKRLFDFACHVLWRQREGEGQGVVVPCAISKVAQPAK
jgi:hypothetical protein